MIVIIIQVQGLGLYKFYSNHNRITMYSQGPWNCGITSCFGGPFVRDCKAFFEKLS